MRGGEKMDLEATIKYSIIDKFSWIERSKLKNKIFSIICNDCVAGGIYHRLGLQYTTPTVGLFFFSEDYIKLLENFKCYITQPLQFKETSAHSRANELRKNMSCGPYPIGLLGNDVEIQFLHYKDEAEAADKWNRRVKRINFENLFFIYSDSDAEGVSDELLLRYQNLPSSFKGWKENKIFFSATPRNFNNIIFVRDYEKATHVGNSTRNRKYEKYIDIIKWLNGEQDFLK